MLHTYRDQLGVTAAPNAGVTLGGPYSHWSWPNNGYYSDIAEQVTIESSSTPGASYFWSQQFDFAIADPEPGGYIGLQDGGGAHSRKIAVFSIWNADATRGPNACSHFTGEGEGYSCHIDPFAWVADRPYELKVADVGNDDDGTWWKASVRDTVSGIEYEVGQIRVPSDWGGIQDWVSWTEYFGPLPASCSAFPKARARFAFPTASAGTVFTSGQSTSFGSGDCRSRIEVLAGAHRQVAPK